MDRIQTLSKNPLYAALAGVVIGLLIGLLIGWVVWPVTWVDAGPGQLSEAWQQDFLRMSIASYGADRNQAQAQERYAALGENGEKYLTEVTQNPNGLDPALVNEFTAIALGQAMPPPALTEAPAVTAPVSAPITGTLPAVEPAAPGLVTEAPAAAPTEEAQAAEEGGSGWLLYILLACVVVLAALGIAAYFMFFRNRFANSTSGPTAAEQAIEMRKQAVPTDYGAQPPVAQFMASYKLGDDLFDDSFSIDSQGGEFLGECGVGISETIGVGDPKKVTAFEVWLFDKNDIQTVTKVLMSRHAFLDNAIRARLEAKGEPEQAEQGYSFDLETQTLTMKATVVNMEYGEGAMPGESYFDHLLLELAIWQKEIPA
ncbi:MAG: hypothetical protein ACKOC5_19830 [Chloroflexota bacterium]